MRRGLATFLVSLAITCSAQVLPFDQASQQSATDAYMLGMVLPAIQSVTNVEKLSLDSATPVGTQVSVNDAFVPANGATGFFAPNGSTNGKPRYEKIPTDDIGDGASAFYYNGTAWTYSVADSGIAALATDGDEDNPWSASWDAITFTHPVTQQLSAPSTANAILSNGGEYPNLAGIYVEAAPRNGRSTWVKANGAYYYWSPDDVGWYFQDETNATIYGSFNADADPADREDVASPDLVSEWFEYNTTVPADPPIIIKAGSDGEFQAGILPAGGGVAGIMVPYQNAGQANGRVLYKTVNDAGHEVTFNATYWAMLRVWDSHLFYRSTATTTFPWNQTWLNTAPADGDSPAPTVARDDIASEANWQVVP